MFHSGNRIDLFMLFRGFAFVMLAGAAIYGCQHNTPVTANPGSGSSSGTPSPPSFSINGGNSARQNNPKDGAEMVLIPAGEFTMGSNEEDKEKPPHKVRLSAYYLYKYPVTVAQYEAFVADMKQQGKQIADHEAKMPIAPDFNPNWSQKDHPMVHVLWYDAEAYCEWAGGRLPTEAQYERAARGPKGYTFPWGNTFDPSKLWCSKSLEGDAGGTHSVGGFEPNGFGLYDMAGNVWEWCYDWYDEKFYGNRLAEQDNPEGPTSGTSRVMRGGSWYNFSPNYLRASKRLACEPAYGGGSIGFRCVVRAEP